MGMVRQLAEFFHEQPLLRVLHGRAARFLKVPRATATACLIEKPAYVEGGLKDASARKDELVFLDFITDQKENVYR